MKNSKLLRQFNLVDIISDLSPWLTPIPSAVLVSNATLRHLGWPEPVGWISGAIVEMLGISTVSTTMLFYNFNQSKRQSDPALPWGVPAALVAVYLASTVVLTVLLDTVPLLARWSPVIFPILALVGAINLVLRSNYRLIVRRIEEERERMRLLRQAARHGTAAQPGLLESAPLSAELQTLPSRQVALPPQVERFICQQCIRSFASRNALNAHMRIHSNGAHPQPESVAELDI